MDDRFAGLSPELLSSLREAGRHLTSNRLDAAASALESLAGLVPDHPEVLRLRASVLQRRGRVDEAIPLLQRALRAQPDDALVMQLLSAMLLQRGASAKALPLLRRCCELAPDLAPAWINLGTALEMEGRFEEAGSAFARAAQADPHHAPARIAHGNGQRASGRIDEAAVEYRAALAIDPRSVGAWVALADLKTVAFSSEETAALERLYNDPTLTDCDRAFAGFALGRVLEDAQLLPEAIETLNVANAIWRKFTPWNRTVFAATIDRVIDAFAAPHAATADPNLGSEIIFIAGLPRSGSTLTEQILSAHSNVEGAGERRELGAVLEEESKRRRQRFPEWVGLASADDWQRMGQRYLDLTARWREHKPVSTDKALSNWLYLGAARSMLPGARFVNCRRDPLETGWSCYKQLFQMPQPFAYAFDDIGAYWHDYDRLMCFWHARNPGRIYDHVYEGLLAAPEAKIRELLEFCGLPFEKGCVRFHNGGRRVGTASAARVRQPLRPDPARAHHYGNLLSPLRRALGL